MLLNQATNKDIITCAYHLGYHLTKADCEEIRQSQVFPDETVEQAVNDFLDAYER